MSPGRTSKKGTGHHVANGAVRELQALLDSAVARIEDKDDSACQIPWRTSRRLQEATLRNLTKERDTDGPLSGAASAILIVKKEKEPPEPSQATRAAVVKRQRSPSSPTTPLDLVNADDSDDADGSGESCGNQDTPKMGIMNGTDGLAEISSRKRKRRSVHFADPLFFFIEDRKQQQQQQQLSVETARKGTTSAARKSISGPQSHVKKEDAGEKTAKMGSRHHPLPKQPMSCFDLLCNYSGTKGWRCYRHCVEGESFCSYHLSSQKTNASPSIVRISLCT